MKVSPFLEAFLRMGLTQVRDEPPRLILFWCGAWPS